jgi:DNA adenine methylase
MITSTALCEAPAVAARDARSPERETCGTSDTIRKTSGGRERPPLRFVGAKSGCGVWQTIISEMPPHSLYVEAFAGTGAVLLRKRPAQTNIAIDSDAQTCAALKATLATAGASAIVICDDALTWLERNRRDFNQRTVVYCDPPYLQSTRKRPERYYAREARQEWKHETLLTVLARLAAGGVNVMLSGYRSELYDRELATWRRVDYRAATRGGPVTECLWCSFEAPSRLHDYRFLGRNFRERERIKRKKARWLGKLGRVTPIEAAAILAALDEWRAAE